MNYVKIGNRMMAYNTIAFNEGTGSPKTFTASQMASVLDGLSKYNSASTYAKDQLVIYNGDIYRSLSINNTGNNPGTSTTKWENIIGNFMTANDNISLLNNDAEYLTESVTSGLYPAKSDVIYPSSTILQSEFSRALTGQAWSNMTSTAAPGTLTWSTSASGSICRISTAIESSTNVQFFSDLVISDQATALPADYSLTFELWITFTDMTDKDITIALDGNLNNIFVDPDSIPENPWYDSDASAKKTAVFVVRRVKIGSVAKNFINYAYAFPASTF